MKKICKFLIALVTICSVVLSSLTVSAAFYTKTITASSDFTKILSLVKQNDGQTCYDKMYYIFYNSQFAAAYNKNFPYPNSGSTQNYVMDNGTKYTLAGASKGCYLYADYVSQYVYGISSWSNKCVTVKINTVAGSMTAQQVKSAITTYAQAGEHIRIDNTHSIAFVAYDDNGFYYTDYLSDTYPKIYVHYTTWSNFANECNSKSKIGMIYDIDRSTNVASSNVTFQIPDPDHSNTITNNNAILWAKVNKTSSSSVTKIGIKVRPDGGDYTTKWSLYHAPSQSYNGSTYMYPYYNLKEELGITLTHATKYYYRFYAVVGGVEYWSAEKSFTTTGSHSYGSWSTTKAATCTAAGSKTRKCTGCSKTETASISALGHNYSSSYTVDKAATCTAAGSKSKHCTRCSAKTSVTAIAATGHSYGAWSTTKSATCVATGSKTRKCSACSATDTQVISALGHNYSSSWTIDKSANCTVAGSKSQHCSRCSAKSNITTTSSLGHSWSEWTVTAEATVNSTGKKTRKCTRNGCSKTETVTIAKLAADGHTHTFGEWKTTAQETCTTDGSQQRICSVCKQIEDQTISATGHTFSMWTIINEATMDSEGLAVRKCDVCEIKEEETIPKIVSDAQESALSEKTDGREIWSLPLMLNILVAVIAVSGVVVAIILLKGKLVKKKK